MAPVLSVVQLTECIDYRCRFRCRWSGGWGHPGREDWLRCWSVGVCRGGERSRVRWILLSVPQPGVVRAQGGVVGAQFVRVLFQVEDLPDAGEVDPVGDELGDPAQPAQIILAVPAGAAAGTAGPQQPVLFVQPQ